MSDPKLKLIYVEDEHADRLLFARLIGIAGASLGIFVDVVCVSAISDLPAVADCDAILLDLSLANGGTISSIEWIKRKHDQLPPIFVLSGHPDQREKCIEAGAVDFFNKTAFSEDADFFVNKIAMGVERSGGRS